MNKSLRITGLILIPAVLLTAIIAIQWQLDAPARQRFANKEKIHFRLVDETAVHLIPAPEELKLLAFGFDSILAELVLIESYSYFYQYSSSGRDNNYFKRMYDGVVRLDPFNLPAYRNGGYFIDTPYKTKTDAVTFFKRGAVSFSTPGLQLSPGWQPVQYIYERVAGRMRFLEKARKEFMPFERGATMMMELGIHYFAYMKEFKNAADIFRAGQYRFPNKAGHFLEMELDMRTQEGQDELVMKLWQDYAEQHADDPAQVAYGIFRYNQYATKVRMSANTKRIQSYKAQHNAYPVNMLFAVPLNECLDTFGDRFIYDAAAGSIYSRVLLMEEIESQYNELNQAIKKWQKDNGTYPLSLDEFPLNLTFHPIAGTFEYEPITGTLNMPLGYGNDIPRLLLRYIGAAYSYAIYNDGVFPSQGSPETLSEYIEEWVKERYPLNSEQVSSIAYIPKAPICGIGITDGNQVWIADAVGPVRSKDGSDIPETWPADLGAWQVITK